MKKLHAVLLLFTLVVAMGCSATSSGIDTNDIQNASGDPADLKQVMRDLQGSDYILIGEKHDNPHHHERQLMVLKASVKPGDTVVFEMLNRDQQPTIDAFQSGSLPYAELEQALNWKESGWPNWQYYGPLMRIAVDAGAKVLFGSYPRAELREKMSGATALNTVLPDAALADLRQEIISSHCDLLPAGMIDPMMVMQIAKDDLMKQQMKNARGSGRSFLIAGNGHVRKDRGVPLHLTAMDPAARVFVLGFAEETEKTDAKALVSRYDALWFTAPSPAVDYCESLRKKFGKKPSAN
ncbi:ChaN family lipoprotein [Sneathiella chinensis]|uniref:Haem-binding uptake Tiki superfamily ChaN domain-containing protein n=1 Tax=Sneathiella chinensis TaxID=349750 RepID=A0ABQ5U9A9_9PROT|nr:ChaN family lipoprotein [Sneathiella chinensis]GLQ07091.1 hypothetical protein GCM10007924_23120 [Sneathiella chinensis]